jgi:hypothetical protein
MTGFICVPSHKVSLDLLLCDQHHAYVDENRSCLVAEVEQPVAARLCIRLRDNIVYVLCVYSNGLPSVAFIYFVYLVKVFLIL